MNLNLFKENGYILLEDFISLMDVEEIKTICYTIKQNIIQNDLIGKPKDFGYEKYWRGLDMASTQSSVLFDYYTSEKMYEVAKTLLETNSIYLFNDQIVVKLPKEDFGFAEHTDNQFGPNNEMALRGEFKTITCCIVLDDFTENNGPISILNKKTNLWEQPLPKKGSLIVWDGNTLHWSGNNESKYERCAWLCVYSTTDLTKVIPETPNTFSKFYNQELNYEKTIKLD